MLRKIRVVIAVLFFIGITLLFLDFTGMVQLWLGWMAKIQFLPALLACNFLVVAGLLLLTLLFGRVYCSVICPLGVMQDVFSWLGGKVKKGRFRYRKPHTWLRYGILCLFVLLMLAGVHSLVMLIAPYSAYGRIASQLFAPLYAWGNNLLAALAEHYGSYAFYPVAVRTVGVSALVVAALTFVVVAAWSFKSGRMWCNTICPVGTVLGFVSRFSLFKPIIDNTKCVHCGRCEKNCKASCVDSGNGLVDYSRCVGCMDCLEQCHAGAIRYGLRKKVKNPQPSAPEDGSRRDFLKVSALVAGGALLESASLKVDGGLAVIEEKKRPVRSHPVRPAGSIDCRHFERHCTACMLCVSNCPQKVLTPSSKLDTMLTPELDFTKGFCRPECTRCSELCPTGAIHRVTVEEKSSIQTGHAVWVAENCIASRDGVHCEACSGHCPSGAIQLVRQENGRMVPAVDSERCIGCGACEYYCPARPFAAIYVEGHVAHRII
ncbi:MAG: 4Fe-4S dicluster domain-containing protein [Bacteroidales bacterium]|nr:4Fe-4S dicluster domain-containing protein [Bacteroidales bacterium]